MNSNNNTLLLFSCSCQIFLQPMDYSLLGSSVHGISQARILEWLPCPLPGDLPVPTIQLMSPALVGRFFYHWTTREVPREKNRNSFIIVRLSLMRELFKHICEFTSLSPMRIQYHLIVTAFTSPIFSLPFLR